MITARPSNMFVNVINNLVDVISLMVIGVTFILENGALMYMKCNFTDQLLIISLKPKPTLNL
jgi:hypothetical protein